MAKPKPKDRRNADDLTPEELEAQRAEQLPDRDVMTALTPYGPPVPVPVENVDAMFPIDPPPKAI
jgi:hypothetical protein